MFKVYPTAKIRIDEPNLCEQRCLMEEFNYEKAYLHSYPHQFKHGTDGDICDQVFIRAKKLTIGENVHIAPGVKIVGNGEVIINDGVTIAPNVVIFSSRPALSFEYPAGNKYGEKFKQLTGRIVIGANTFIGAGAVVGVNEKGEDLLINPGTVIRALHYFDGHSPMRNPLAK